jgi:hypothetical protein
VGAPCFPALTTIWKWQKTFSLDRFFQGKLLLLWHFVAGGWNSKFSLSIRVILFVRDFSSQLQVLVVNVYLRMIVLGIPLEFLSILDICNQRIPRNFRPPLLRIPVHPQDLARCPLPNECPLENSVLCTSNNEDIISASLSSLIFWNAPLHQNCRFLVHRQSIVLDFPSKDRIAQYCYLFPLSDRP